MPLLASNAVCRNASSPTADHAATRRRVPDVTVGAGSKAPSLCAARHHVTRRIVPTLQASDQEETEMLNGDAARYRTQDMMRSSQAHRESRAVAKRRSERRHARVRGVLTSAITLVTLPTHR
jgi:hypothetical protein